MKRKKKAVEKLSKFLDNQKDVRIAKMKSSSYEEFQVLCIQQHADIQEFVKTCKDD